MKWLDPQADLEGGGNPMAVNISWGHFQTTLHIMKIEWTRITMWYIVGQRPLAVEPTHLAFKNTLYFEINRDLQEVAKMGVSPCLFPPAPPN